MKVNPSSTLRHSTSSLALSLCLALAFAGCGKKEESSTPQSPTAPAPGGAPQKKLKLAFVSNNAANFWTIARRGCEAAEKELGNVEVLFRIPSEGSAAQQ